MFRFLINVLLGLNGVCLKFKVAAFIDDVYERVRVRDGQITPWGADALWDVTMFLWSNGAIRLGYPCEDLPQEWALFNRFIYGQWWESRRTRRRMGREYDGR